MSTLAHSMKQPSQRMQRPAEWMEVTPLSAGVTVRSFQTSALRMAETVQVPQMAESISEGTLKQWNKKKGDFVEADEEVATIETDKVGRWIRCFASFAAVLSHTILAADRCLGQRAYLGHHRRDHGQRGGHCDCRSGPIQD